MLFFLLYGRRGSEGHILNARALVRRGPLYLSYPYGTFLPTPYPLYLPTTLTNTYIFLPATYFYFPFFPYHLLPKCNLHLAPFLQPT